MFDRRAPGARKKPGAVPQDRVILGYRGGVRGRVVVVEVSWATRATNGVARLGAGAPSYTVRTSKASSAAVMGALRSDKRVCREGEGRDGEVGVVVACDADEIETLGLVRAGWDATWVRAIDGTGSAEPGGTRAAVPMAEIGTVLRTLARERRLFFPMSLGALGRRAGGPLTLDDHEHLALGLACWYAFTRDDGVRASEPEDAEESEEPWETFEEMMP